MSDPYQRDNFTIGAGRRICPGSRSAENILDLALVNTLWAFEIKPPSFMIDGKERRATMNPTDDAFEQTAFRAPMPFRVQFCPRNEGQLQIIEENWNTAKKKAYVLRGLRVDARGIVHLS